MTTPRAFSLVIVVVLGVAAFVVASTLLAVSESARSRTAHSVQGDKAAAIAQAGMERTRAYLQAKTTPAGDFDLVLDPLDEANCSPLPAAAATAALNTQVLRPEFTDGTRVTYHGKSWTRVAYDGGAYLIRFEDDTDDLRIDGRWNARSSNTLGATNCFEGPADLGGTADNPFRDRNQTIVVTVIGIAPGTDPDRAVHRATLRRVESLGGTSAVAGIQVDGNIDLNGTADLFACSDKGSLVVDGNLTAGGSTTGCACGDSRADTISGNWDHCTATPGVCPAAVGCTAGTLDTPGPNVPAVQDFTTAAGKDFFFDWSRPCIFYVDTKGLWFYEAQANRGPGSVPCANVEGAPVPFPRINPNDPTDFKRCWTPILLGIDGAPAAVFPAPDSELTGSSWTPKNVAATKTVDGAFNTLLGTHGYTAFPVGTVLTKPAWETACTVTYLTEAPRGCTTCNGATVAMEAISGQFWFSADSPAQLHAIPAGTYYYPSNVGVTGSAGDFGLPLPGVAPDFATFNLDDWPLMTVAVEGNLSLQGRTYLGIGQADAAFASVILKGNFNFQASDEKFIAGSVWSTGNWDWGGGSDNFYYGELHLNGNWNISGNGQFHWRYLNALSPATVLSSPAVPTQHRSLD